MMNGRDDSYSEGDRVNGAKGAGTVDSVRRDGMVNVSWDVYGDHGAPQATHPVNLKPVQ